MYLHCCTVSDNIMCALTLKYTIYLIICVCVYLCVFVISEHQWIVGVMSYQKIYDLIGLA